jgi:hypothetical protein
MVVIVEVAVVDKMVVSSSTAATKHAMVHTKNATCRKVIGYNRCPDYDTYT